MPEALVFRPCRADDPADVAAVQALLEAAPDYALRVEGRLPRPGDALEALADLPPGVQPEAKLFGVYWQADERVGCLDLVRGYPEPTVAYLGLLLFAERVHGRGLGTEALAHAESLARGWGCTALRLAVIETNLPALRFWRRRGFRELYRKPMPRFTGEAIVMERAL